MKTRLFSFIHKMELFDQNGRLLLLVSGGADSMVLLHLLSSEFPNIEVLHFNFKLRGAESDADQLFVENECKKKGITCYTRVIDTKTISAKKKLSIQLAARLARQIYCKKFVSNNIDYIVTGHNMTDNLETTIFRLIRGTLINGMAGIKPKRGFYRSPLLCCSREEIRQFAQTEGIAFREDSSNLKTDYTRNKIRHELLPIVYQLNPKAAHTVFKNSLLTSAQASWLNHESVSLLEQTNENEFLIDTSKFLPNKDIRLGQITSLLTHFEIPTSFAHHLNLNPSGKQFLGKRWKLTTSGSIWKIEKTSKPSLNIIDIPIPLRIGENIYPAQAIKILVSHVHSFVLPTTKNIAYLNTELADQLFLRNVAKGDRIKPLGMKGKSKLVSDILIDEKVPTWQRPDIYAIVNHHNELVWLIGFRIAEFAAAKSTGSAIKIEFFSSK